MTAGIYRNSDHSSLTEPWRERTEKSALAAAEKRIRGKVAELYELSERAAGSDCKRLVRRALVEAEGLCQLAENALRRDWLER